LHCGHAFVEPLYLLVEVVNPDLVLLDGRLVELSLPLDQVAVDLGESFPGGLLLAEVELQLLHPAVDGLQFGRLLLEQGQLLGVELVFLVEAVVPGLERVDLVDFVLEEGVEPLDLSDYHRRVVLVLLVLLLQLLDVGLQLADDRSQLVAFVFETVALALELRALARQPHVEVVYLFIQCLHSGLVVLGSAVVFVELGSFQVALELADFLVEFELAADKVLVFFLFGALVVLVLLQLVLQGLDIVSLALQHKVQPLNFLAKKRELILILLNPALVLVASFQLLL
jgi:hypothetical protein